MSEHCDCPICELRSLKRRLAPGGALLVAVRNDGVDVTPTFNAFPDKNHHIYTWNPLLLTNLISNAGYHVCDTIEEFSAWPTKVSPVLYLRDRYTFCQDALKRGNRIKALNVMSVAVNPEDKHLCTQFTSKLKSVLNCKYLEGASRDAQPPRIENAGAESQAAIEEVFKASAFAFSGGV
eukprot:Selendium_serpulae@DN5956_c3_g1_i3.p1